MSVDKRTLTCQGSVGCHKNYLVMSGLKYSSIQHHFPPMWNRQTTQIRKVLQQYFYNSKADTLAVAIDLGNMLKEASKSVCIREQCYIIISSPNLSTSVMCTDPQ